MATWVQPRSANQADSANSPAVVVAKVCTSTVTSRPAARRALATTVSLCTSKPAQRG
jgi:hypothetical protein